MSDRPALRIANCSGFYGDRLAAAEEMVTGGAIDVLTGDWLAELTMGVLAKQRKRSAAAGHATTFVRQLEDVLGAAVERGIKIVSNAGGLNPHSCAAEVRELARRGGLSVRVAVVDGDDATEVFASARSAGWHAPHLDSDEPFAELGTEPHTVNAYLGGWGIKAALDAGADVVITGRVTDAAIILGPAAWHHRWDRSDWSALAGAVVAGHVIECGAQATGGNFSFFRELDGLRRVGFPIAELAADGSAVITKHPGTGGAVTVETVTAQLLYEIDGPRYANPDVVSRLDTVELAQVGPDRVLVSGTQGEPAPPSVKVGAITTAGWRNEVTFVLTGSDVQEKAALAEEALWANIDGGSSSFDRVTTRLVDGSRTDPASMMDAVSLLTIAVADASQARADAFPRQAIETGLASYPGLYFTAPPARASEMTVFWPTLMPAESFPQRMTLDDDRPIIVPPPTPAGEATPSAPDGWAPAESEWSPSAHESVERMALGRLLGARSGDKAGNATLGVWARTDDAHAWLRSWWTEQAVRDLVPEAASCVLRMWELPRLRACGVTIVGLLGHGVAANLDLDSQGKGLAEYVRAKHVNVPGRLIPQPSPTVEHDARSRRG